MQKIEGDKDQEWRDPDNYLTEDQWVLKYFNPFNETHLDMIGKASS
jgi:hypothetical protein